MSMKCSTFLVSKSPQSYHNSRLGPSPSKDYVLLLTITCYALCIRIEKRQSVPTGLQSGEALHYASKAVTYLEVLGVGIPSFLTPVLMAGVSIPSGDSSKRISLTMYFSDIIYSALIVKQLKCREYKTVRGKFEPILADLQNLHNSLVDNKIKLKYY